VKVEILTPEKVMSFEDTAVVSFKTKEGEMGVMAGHENMITLLYPGIVSVQQDKQVNQYFITSGFAKISDSIATLVVEEIFDKTNISREMLDEKKKDLENTHEHHPEYKEKMLVVEALTEMV